MALSAPKSIEVDNILFKLRAKFPVFNQQTHRNNINLIAVSHSVGLVIVGDPNVPELKVLQLKNVHSGEQILARQIPLPNVPNNLEVSYDGSLLAVHYLRDGLPLIALYNVHSLTSSRVQNVHNYCISSEKNVSALQILWNPEICYMLAVVVSNGSLLIHNFNDKLELKSFYPMEKSEQAKCASWSPKGKQIVVGFPNGKICQYKPDLKVARVIVCPPNIHQGPFDIIALQWLSNYQFAAVFLQQGGSPNLYIVNAPKVGPPTYINYFDICYSSDGPRTHQITLMHIQPWNILLMASANSQEIGILGTKEPGGEIPLWSPFLLEGDSRIEIPLNENKEDGYPVGFALDVGTSHQVIFSEEELPVMPMIHVLSSHGVFLGYDFLNLIKGIPEICSPIPELVDATGLTHFKPIKQILDIQNVNTSTKHAVNETELTTDFSFNSLGATSTPALKDKPKSMFSAFSQSPAAETSVFSTLSTNIAPSELQSQSVTNFSFSDNLFGQSNASNNLTTLQSETLKNEKKEAESIKFIGSSKPLLYVPPVYTPPPSVNVEQPIVQQVETKSKESGQNSEMAEIGKQIVSTLVNSFESELNQFLHSSSTTNTIDDKRFNEILAKNSSRLVALQEIDERAHEKDFEIEFQNLRHSLKETHTMHIETITKVEMYKNPEIAKIAVTPSELQINRRNLSKFRNEVNKIKTHLSLIQQQIDSQWSNYQDVVKCNTESKMRVPSLERVYQALTNEKDILARTRQKLRVYKAKADSMDHSKKSYYNANIESLTDSIMSINLLPIIDENKLSEEKANALLNVLDNRKERSIILPRRPNRVGIKSEVILETKQKLQKEREACSLHKMEQQRIDDQKHLLTKPTATKPVPSPAVVLANASSIFPPKANATFSVSSNKTIEPENTNPLSSVSDLNSSTLPTPISSFGKKTESNTITNTITAPISFTAQVFGGDPKPITPSFSLPRSSMFSTVSGSDVSSKENEPKICTNLPAQLFGQASQGFGNSNISTSTEKSAFQFKPSSPGFPFGTGTGTTLSGSAPVSTSTPSTDLTTQAKATATSSGNIFSGFGLSTKTTTETTTSSNFNLLSFGTTTNTISPFATTASGTTTIFSSAPTPSSFSFSSFGITPSTTSFSLTTTPSSVSTENSSVAEPGIFTSSTETVKAANDPDDTFLNSLNICKPTSLLEAKSTVESSTSSSETPIGGSPFGALNLSSTTASDTKSVFSSIGSTITSVVPALPKVEDKILSKTTVNTPPASPASAVSSVEASVNITSSMPLTTSSNLTITAVEKSPATSVEFPAQFSIASLKAAFPQATPPAFGEIISTAPSIFAQVTATETSTTGSSGFSQPTFFSSSSAATSTGSIFGGATGATAVVTTASSIFGGTTGTTAVVTTTASIFGVSSTTNTLPSSPFGAVASSAFGTPPVTSSTQINSGGSIFSGFSAPQTISTTPIGGSLFGSSFGSVTSSSNQGIFGTAAASTSSASQGIFASASTLTSSPNTGIFAAAAATTPPPTSGSVFGQNVFNQTSQSSGSLFGNSSAAPSTGIGFSSGSLFGNTSATNASSGQGSIFGGTASQQQQTNNQSFGATAGFGDSGNIFGQSSFGSQSPTGSFAQGGPSIAQTGFGSPGSFQKPAIGSGAPMFGSPASFGGPPSFGGIATFGSPKGFGSFATTQSPTAFSSPPTQKNSLFESLGSSETGLSFGNLAQSGNENSNKPAFGGGSAFMNYRA